MKQRVKMAAVGCFSPFWVDCLVVSLSRANFSWYETRDVPCVRRTWPAIPPDTWLGVDQTVVQVTRVVG